jgi:hypothetical protein
VDIVADLDYVVKTVKMLRRREVSRSKITEPFGKKDIYELLAKSLRRVFTHWGTLRKVSGSYAH